MLALKLVFLACAAKFWHDRHPHPRAATSPPPPSSRAASPLSCFADVPASCRWPALAAIVIGLSRLLLGVHCAAGGGVGRGGGASPAHGALLLLAGRPPPDLGVLPLSPLVAVAIVLVFHGLHFPAEAHIRATAFRFAQILGSVSVG